jgi:hypothetical protein
MTISVLALRRRLLRERVHWCRRPALKIWIRLGPRTHRSRSRLTWSTERRPSLITLLRATLWDLLRTLIRFSQLKISTRAASKNRVEGNQICSVSQMTSIWSLLKEWKSRHQSTMLKTILNRSYPSFHSFRASTSRPTESQAKAWIPRWSWTLKR